MPRTLRLARGLSERQLGRMIGESGNVIGRLERGHGHARLTLGRLARVAEALGIHPSALIAGDATDHPSAAAADDARIEAALLRSPVLVSVAELGRGLGLDRDRVRSALETLEGRLAGTGARLHRAPNGYAIAPREELLRAGDVSGLERGRIDRRALDRRSLTLLYAIFASASGPSLERRLGAADRVALGRLLTARLVEHRDRRYLVAPDVLMGVMRDAGRRTCQRADQRSQAPESTQAVETTRGGVHTGEVETINDKVGGVAVNIGARIAALARPGEVLVSSTVKDLTAGSGLAYVDAGEHELKGIPGAWHVYRVATPAAT